MVVLGGKPMLIVYGITIFTGAALLFVVQPMVGRMVLPLLGGSPAVWNTAMVFYQAVLLAGYAYAHFTTRWLGVRRQAALHAVLLLLPFLAMPVMIPHGWAPPTTHNPIPWLLAVLAMTVGVPFFVVSATSPLLQRWFSASGHRDAADPYFLYAASNCGSLLALVGYPAFIEPHLRLSQQSQWWTVGYDLLAGLTAVCGLWITRKLRLSGVTESSPAEASADAPPEKLTARRRWRWVVLAFVPCSLMLSVTTYITSEVAPIPLLWVIPLGIYLLAFILVFARRRVLPRRWMVGALPVAVAAVVATLIARMVHPIGVLIGLHLACLFIVSMVCLGELADDRPSTAHLTEFYLWLSAGGVLGGIFNAMLAPVIFSTVVEYPADARAGVRADAELDEDAGDAAAASLRFRVAADHRAVRGESPGSVAWGDEVAGLRHDGGDVRRADGAVPVVCTATAAVCVGVGGRARGLRVRAGVCGPHVAGGAQLFRHPPHQPGPGGTISLVDAWEHDPRHPTRRSARARRAIGLFYNLGTVRAGIRDAGRFAEETCGRDRARGGIAGGYGRRGERWTFYEIDPRSGRDRGGPAVLYVFA